GQRNLSSKMFLNELPPLTSKLYKDTADTAIKFYKDCFVTVSKEGFDIKPMSELGTVLNDQCIFPSQIIEIEIGAETDLEMLAKGSQSSELSKLSTNDKLHLRPLLCSKGFLTHDFKNPSLAKIIIYTD